MTEASQRKRADASGPLPKPMGKSHRRMVSSQHNLDYYCKAYTSYYTAFNHNHNLNPKSLHIKLPGTGKKKEALVTLS